jgi:hypothetical protein
MIKWASNSTPTSEDYMRNMKVSINLNITSEFIKDVIETAKTGMCFGEFLGGLTFSEKEVKKGIRLAFAPKTGSLKHRLLDDLNDNSFGGHCDPEDAVNILQYAKYGKLLY